MLVRDIIYSWKGWGGKLRLGSGMCRLRIYDFSKGDSKGIAHLRPIIAVVSDVPESKMSIRSCAGHIATMVSRDFHIDAHRMLWIEHYPVKTYGEKNERVIPESFEAVDFEWHEDNAIKPKWRTLKPPLLDEIANMVKDKGVKDSKGQRFEGS
ncbi:MAG: hypothetical protein KKE00_05635 [Proteobacteria bacterium]|nr:hypothetical protein [Pseudomonadota bacterium]MBU1399211.1 hypothetical protein [Pseudomonadota bacterium]MBU1569989.1 hypothetical protein [Pseudomonadota bacterium]